MNCSFSFPMLSHSQIRCVVIRGGGGGGGNVDVWRYVFYHHNMDPTSIIVGSSTHNERIERLWCDVFRCVGQLFYSLLSSLEEECLLDPLNTFFHKSRMGILLAYALMMHIIHQFNTKENKSRQPIFRPIALCN